MAARVLCLRPHLLLGLRKRLVLTNRDFSRPQGSRLSYNPSCYHQWHATLSQSQSDKDEDGYCVSNIPTSFRQQCSRYSISSSCHISSGKNTLFDLASSTSPESESQYVQRHSVPVSPDVRFEPRAFLKCRPEYSSMTVDLTQPPGVITWTRAAKLLQKAPALSGSVDFADLIVELSSVKPVKIARLRKDKRYAALLRYSMENRGLLTDVQLLDVLQSFVRLKMPSTHTLLCFYEQELCRRASQMDLRQLLFAADLWRCIGKQVPQFLQVLYESVGSQFTSLTVPELVHLMYIIGESRQCPAGLVKPLERLLMRHLEQLQPEEVGTVCLGLFKSKTLISELLAMRIFDKAHDELAGMSNYALVNVVKYMRFTYMHHKPCIEAMTHEVPRRAHGMNVQGLMHMILGCSSFRYRSDPILRAVAERIPSLLPHCRSKDLCKLLWSYGNLMFPPDQSPNIYLILTQALRERKDEFSRFPQHLLTGLLGLAFVSHFPEDLISLALSPDFIKSTQSTELDLRKDFLTLDGALAMELPHWTGPRLSPELRAEVSEMVWNNAQTEICPKPEIVVAESSLQVLLGGAEFVSKRMILPHTRSIDFEVHLDSRGRPVALNQTSDPPDTSKSNLEATLTEDLIGLLTNSKNITADPAAQASVAVPAHRAEPHEHIYYPGLKLTSVVEERLATFNPTVPEPRKNSDVVKLAIQVSTRNHYCSQLRQLTGFHAMKRRHLKMAGYKVVELNFAEWFPLLRKPMIEKLTYLNCKIYDSLT